MNTLSFDITRNTKLPNVYREMESLENYLNHFYKKEVDQIWKQDQKKLNYLIIFDFIGLILLSFSLYFIPYNSINGTLSIVLILILGLYAENNRRKTVKSFDQLLKNIYEKDRIVVNDLQYYELGALIKKGDQQLIAYELIDKITKDNIKMNKSYRKYEIVQRKFDTFENLINFLYNKR